jgi:hypothetical protein
MGDNSVLSALLLLLLLLLCEPTNIMAHARKMNWNQQDIPYSIALQIGWNLPQDVVGAVVYGGIVKRHSKTGAIIVGDE